MAPRPGFKRWWTRLVPKAVERSTFVLATVAMFGLMFRFWQPIPGVVWDVAPPFVRGAIYAVAVLGWLIVLLSTFLIGHFELFGLAQVWTSKRPIPASTPNSAAGPRACRPSRAAGPACPGPRLPDLLAGLGARCVEPPGNHPGGCE